MGEPEKACKAVLQALEEKTYQVFEKNEKIKELEELVWNLKVAKAKCYPKVGICKACQRRKWEEKKEGDEDVRIYQVKWEPEEVSTLLMPCQHAVCAKCAYHCQNKQTWHGTKERRQQCLLCLVTIKDVLKFAPFEFTFVEVE